MNLQVECDVVNQAGYIPSEAQGLVHGPVGTLYVQDNVWVIDDTQAVSNLSQQQLKGAHQYHW